MSKQPNKYIFIVGMGALGSHVFQFLRNEDAWFSLIDFDRVETKNTASQFHSKKSVGKNKAAASLEVANFMWGMKNVTAYSNKMIKSNVVNLLGINPENHLVIDCLDNGESRRILQNHIREYRIPCLHGALAADGQFGRVIWDKDFIIDDEDVAGQATCEGGVHLPFIGMAASMLAHAAQIWLRTSKHVGFSISPGGIVII